MQLMGDKVVILEEVVRADYLRVHLYLPGCDSGGVVGGRVGLELPSQYLPWECC